MTELGHQKLIRTGVKKQGGKAVFWCVNDSEQAGTAARATPGPLHPYWDKGT